MDDLMPNDGSTFFQPGVPEETQAAIEAEKQKATESIPFLLDVDEWFEAQLLKIDSLQFAIKEAEKRGKPIETVIIALDVLCDMLAEKRGKFNTMKLTLKK